MFARNVNTQMFPLGCGKFQMTACTVLCCLSRFRGASGLRSSSSSSKPHPQHSSTYTREAWKALKQKRCEWSLGLLESHQKLQSRSHGDASSVFPTQTGSTWKNAERIQFMHRIALDPSVAWLWQLCESRKKSTCHRQCIIVVISKSQVRLGIRDRNLFATPFRNSLQVFKSAISWTLRPLHWIQLGNKSIKSTAGNQRNLFQSDPTCSTIRSLIFWGYHSFFNNQ